MVSFVPSGCLVPVLYLTSTLLTLTSSDSFPNYASNEYNSANNIVDKGHINQCGCLQGTTGTPGVPGVPGMHGFRGADGHRGDIGEKGEPGLDGMSGVTGQNGPEGPPGTRGKKGTPGSEGPKGNRGEIGLPGEEGLTGLPGTRGDPGLPARPERKIAFSVIRSTKLGPVLQDTPVTFDRVVTNLGEGFDEYSSHFVCHLNGTYIFMTHILGQNNKDVYAWIMLNNKHKVPLHGDGRAGYGTGSQTIIVHLKYDDHVWIQLSKDSGLLNDYSTFSGYILYDDTQ